MSLTIDVSPETAERLHQAAVQSNLSVQDFLSRLIDAAVRGNGESIARSGAELVRIWRDRGVIGAWRDKPGAADSVARADELRRAAQTRSRD